MEYIVLLSIVCVILIYICFNLYFKVIKLETLLEQDRAINIDLLERLVKMFLEANRRLDSIDSKKIFKDDDDVGFIFKLIRAVIVEVTDKINKFNTIYGETKN